MLSVAPLVKTMSPGSAGAEGFGHAFASQLDRRFGAPAEDVGLAGGVPEILAEIGKHRFQDPRVDGCGGVMIEVDRSVRRRRTGHSRRRIWRSGS